MTTTCPPECTNTDYGTCPRCFRETGLGCAHGPLCADCAQEIATQTTAAPKRERPRWSSETKPVQAMHPCGCHHTGREIQWCSLHAAAEPMREALHAIADALDVPRNRFGKLTYHPGRDSGEALRLLAVRYEIGGAEDAPDQAVKVARAALKAAGQEGG